MPLSRFTPFIAGVGRLSDINYFKVDISVSSSRGVKLNLIWGSSIYGYGSILMDVPDDNPMLMHINPATISKIEFLSILQAVLLKRPIPRFGAIVNKETPVSIGQALSLIKQHSSEHRVVHRVSSASNLSELILAPSQVLVMHGVTDLVSTLGCSITDRLIQSANSITHRIISAQLPAI